MSSKYVLYCDPRSTCSMKATHALYEAGIEFEMRMINLQTKEQKTPEFTALNPFGKVPVLVTPDGRTLYESEAIQKYLARVSPVSLLPSDAYLEGVMEQFISISASYFKPEMMKIYVEKILKTRYGSGDPDQARIQEGMGSVGRILDILEAHFASGQGPYLLGDQYTLADMAFMPEMFWLDAAGAYELVRERQRVFEWMERCRARPAWHSVVELARANKPMETTLIA